MAGSTTTKTTTRLFLKYGREANHLWVVLRGYSWLIEFADPKRPQIKRATRLQGSPDFITNGYRQVREFEVLEVLIALKAGQATLTEGLIHHFNQPKQLHQVQS